jgi:hypothetical protein
MSDNSNDYWAGYQTGLSGGSMPTYETIRSTHGEAAANWAYDGYNQAQASGNSSSGK